LTEQIELVVHKPVIIISQPKVWTRCSDGGRMITSFDARSYARRDTAASTHITKKIERSCAPLLAHTSQRK
jgi:hypothetical protein